MKKTVLITLIVGGSAMESSRRLLLLMFVLLFLATVSEVSASWTRVTCISMIHILFKLLSACGFSFMVVSRYHLRLIKVVNKKLLF
jgi:hypothetical protein